MSKIYKCDRCKQQFASDDKTKEWDTPTKLAYGDLDTKKKLLYEYHICPECTRDFMHFMFYNDEYKLVKRKKSKKD